MTPPWGNLKDDTPMQFAKSAFQKCIRRGMENEALYLARQFYEAGQETWIWRRLLVISCEDIGLGDLSVVKYLTDTVLTLHVAWRLIGKSKLMNGENAKSDLLPLYAAVMVCCRANKSRAADSCAVWFNSNPTWRPPLDGEFLDED
jgi:replication-associated recombination protein RarA